MDVDDVDITIVELHGKHIGIVYGYTFLKHIVESKHLLKKPPAIAYDKSVVRGLKTMGVIYLLVKGQGRFFESDIETLERYGITINRGHGEQLALPLEYWTIRKESNAQDDSVDAVEEGTPVSGDETPRQYSFLRGSNSRVRKASRKAGADTPDNPTL